ncbi:hypothetical protein [uncultured Alsobacter sp.]|uniref:hypothetical protein n=1 Tax=uncultured Alsobacter sp. TaxID=1748258 RepID=UPI0025EDC20E|nr:hypothetical protein [uncultured Alsobacter sp.]
MCKELVRMEMSGPGDVSGALDRVARRYDLPRGMLWTLRYRHQVTRSLPWPFVEKLREAFALACVETAERMLGRVELARLAVPDQQEALDRAKQVAAALLASIDEVSHHEH